MNGLRQFILKLLWTRNNRREPDWNLLITVSIIIIFGLVMLSSASGALAYSRFHDAYFFIKHQSLALVIGLFLFVIFARQDYRAWRELSIYFLLGSILLLLTVFVPGLASNANDKARSWISIFGFSLQPSEFVKLAFLIYFAAWLETKGKNVSDLKEGLMPFMITYGIIAVLMLAQPDFGTLSIITVIALMSYFIGGGKSKHIAAIVGLGIIGIFIMASNSEYQANRFKCYFDPLSSADDHCYQLNQSMLAIGSGGLWGRGFGASRQKIMYLPEVSGDAIFPIIGEELGFIFSAGLIILFLNLFYRGYKIAINAPDHFGKVLAFGISTWLAAQAFINIGGMINLMPMTGVPLPLVSAGGSSVMAALAAVGLLTNISRQTNR
jgi:cell division protein FtsW